MHRLTRKIDGDSPELPVALLMQKKMFFNHFVGVYYLVAVQSHLLCQPSDIVISNYDVKKILSLSARLG